MAENKTSQLHPRPDFVHANERWSLLHDGWTILYDDEDVGLQRGWHQDGTPDKVTLSTQGVTDEEAQRLAAFPELKQRGFAAHGRTENNKAPIRLPYAFQTPASGLGHNEAHEVLWYERKAFPDPRRPAERNAGDRVLLRFGAVDYEASLWANGALVAEHRGGHVPFDADLTDALARAEGGGSGGANLHLVLRVRDSPYDLTQPRGKQYWGPVPESIFYKPTSGIWQNVWWEVVPSARIASSSDGTILRANNIDDGVLEATVAVLGRRAQHNYLVEIEASLHGVSVAKEKASLTKEKNHVGLSAKVALGADALKTAVPQSLRDAAPLDDPRAWHQGTALWSPDFPTLYDVTIRLYDSTAKVVDEVRTYTGFRNIDWARGDGTFRLNGRPIFMALNLDQGYWPETGLTPPDADSLRRDIVLAKAMGMNGCRKHQKVEDPAFHYWADRLGYLVWGEMANAYEYSEEYTRRFDQEWIESVKRDINHPCVVMWTPINESWAYPDLKGSVQQRNHIRQLYYMTKTLDPTRPVNDNCGWEHVLTDISSFHDYHDAAYLETSCATQESMLATKLCDRPFHLEPIYAADGKTVLDPGSRHKEGAPLMNTEFAGVNIAPQSTGGGAATGDGERDWGYTTASDSGDLLRRVEALVKAVVKSGKNLGFVYTQLTDIEQEVNGLYTFDRKEKIPAAEVKKVFEAAAKFYLDQQTI